MRLHVVAALSSVLWLCAACADAKQHKVIPMAVTTTDSAGILIIRLSQSPTYFSQTASPPVLSSSMTIGGAASDFGMIVDAEHLQSGGFAVLDRLRRRVAIFNEPGELLLSFGREGDGPGEFRYPLALEEAGSSLVVWQENPTSAFITFSKDGTVIETAPQLIAGDWARYGFRAPLVDAWGDQEGPEDVQRRLVGYDSGFIHLLQWNEFTALREDASTPRHPRTIDAVRYTSPSEIADTLWTYPAVDTRRDDPLPGGPPMWTQPLFSSRPVLAAGRSWIASGQGSARRIEVRDSSGELKAVLSWPYDRLPVTDTDRLEAAKWIVALRVTNSPDSRSVFESHSRRRRRQGIETTAFEYTTFADSTPMVAAAFGAGRCLFLAGHRAEDFVDGTSATWLVVDVENGAYLGAFRLQPDHTLVLERRGLAVRSVSKASVLALHRDDLGSSYLERFDLPNFGC